MALAVAVAWAHRSWIAADPCERRSLPGGSPVLEDLSFRHDQQLRQLEGAHKMLQAAALLSAAPAQRVDVIDRTDRDYAQRLEALAMRQRDEMIRACRQSQ